jgi:hypothetical protein
MRTHLLLCLALLGACSDDNKKTPDAGAGSGSDAAGSASDAMTTTLDCTMYCNTITAACTAGNAQFGGTSAADATAHCMGTCASFDTSTAQAGATLGCHIYHAMAAMASQPDFHCPHAGPAGDKIGMAGFCGDPCTNFCTLVQKTCGVKGTDANGQYTDMTDCMNACNGFEKTVQYTVNTTTFPSANPTGDNLACRLYHATNAAVSATAANGHCPHTAVVSTVCKAP